MSKLQPVRGTKDLLPDSFKVHEHIIKTAQKIGDLYGYLPMSTPIIEYTKVFDRTLGYTSDVVAKEMYQFLDKSNESICLRPEFTASIMRSFVHNGQLWHNLPLRFFSYGPLFRYDRPQAGRQRQFHQINFEYIGGTGPYSDAELIKLAFDVLVALGVQDDVKLELNSLGCAESRNIYEKKLVEYFVSNKEQLSQDSLKRLTKNPLRILDSKDENDIKLAKNAPIISDYYTEYAKEYFAQLQHYLDLLKVNYTLNSRLVRGLDYYCHTTFEFTTSKLGAQSTILAGGRYDGLAKLMDGPDAPAIGFAAGIERIALLREYNLPLQKSVYILPINPSNIDTSLVLADQLRQHNVNVILDVHGKISKRMQRIVVRNVQYVIFVGDDEQLNKTYRIKDIKTETEIALKFDQLVAMLEL